MYVHMLCCCVYCVCMCVCLSCICHLCLCCIHCVYLYMRMFTHTVRAHLHVVHEYVFNVHMCRCSTYWICRLVHTPAHAPVKCGTWLNAMLAQRLGKSPLLPWKDLQVLGCDFLGVPELSQNILRYGCSPTFSQEGENSISHGFTIYHHKVCFAKFGLGIKRKEVYFPLKSTCS